MASPTKEDLKEIAGIYAQLKKRYVTFEDARKLIERFTSTVKTLRAPLERLTAQAERAIKEQEQGLKRLETRLRSVKDGKPGEKGDPGHDGLDGEQGPPGKNGSSDTPKEVLKKLREAGLAIRDVKGLEAALKELKDRPAVVRQGVFGGGRPVHVPIVDVFTGDGSNKTFYLSKAPRDLRTVKAWGSDFPHIMTNGTSRGFVISGKQLVLNSDIDAPTIGGTLVVEFYT